MDITDVQILDAKVDRELIRLLDQDGFTVTILHGDTYVMSQECDISAYYDKAYSNVMKSL